MVREEDTDGDGKVDTLWIDNDGDGEIGVGDGAAFFDDGPWSNLNSQQFSDMLGGLQSYLASLGWDVALEVTAGAGTGLTVNEMFKLKVEGKAAGIVGDLVVEAHKILIAMLGNIDLAESNEIATSHYADQFGGGNYYNPYTNGDGMQTYQQP
ncbi:MAG: hypothetical protein EON90_11460 [Brevundimonas sp.]|nr:MAG: hypothetical protein EON90_11460 [Brevundimonas sp.]